MTEQVRLFGDASPEVMNLTIAFECGTAEENSYQLESLATLIKDECCFELKINRVEAAQGVRDGGLAIAIAIASLGVTAIQTLVSVFQYWEAKNPKYSLSIRMGNEILLIENLPIDKFKRELRRIQMELPTASIEVQISETYK